MRYLTILLAAIMISVPVSQEWNVMADSVDTDKAARQEIEVLIASEDSAWNKGDAVGFAARVLPDVIFTNVVGMFTIGKSPFVAQHDRIFSTIYKGSTLQQSIQHIVLLKPDVAIVDTLAVLNGFQHTPPGIQTIDGAIHTRLEQVLMRREDGWWVASFHNVAVNPQSAPPIPR